jgi:predicted DNA-binding protein
VYKIKDMAPSNKSEIIPVRVAPELKQELLELADRDSRSLSDYIRLQLVKVVESSKKKK